MSFRRLLIQVKEWREAIRSAGNRIGAAGQSSNSRDWRVERDFSAVKDKATSSEQLARRRETRWRNGVPESQSVALLREVQGSREVMMLRDWRARICLGSSVECEIEEEEEECGVGDEVGEREGGRVLVAEMVEVVKKMKRTNKVTLMAAAAAAGSLIRSFEI